MSQSNPMVRTFRGSPYRAFSEFFEQNSLRPQRYRINAGRLTTLVGEKGTRLTFEPFSLADISGQVVTGDVEIRLTEVFSRSEMIVSDKVSTSEDRLLESGGQILVQAIQNHQLLELSSPVRVELPVSPVLNNPLAMRLFEGSTAKTRAFRATRSFDWKLVSNQTVPVVRIEKKKYFRFQLQRFRWVNCDYFFARRRSRTMVTVQHEGIEGPLDDRAAFLVFRDYNAVAKMYPAGNRFTSFNIPEKLAATAVVLGLENGQLLLGATAIDRTSNRLVQVELYPVEEADLLTFIHQLA